MEERGFSFIEILVALLLSTSISLALLKQQWQINRLRHQLQAQMEHSLRDHNQREQGLSILECMLSLGLALSLMTILLHQYLQIKQQTQETARVMLQASRLQTVMAVLRQAGHQAGFTPCLPLDALRTFDHRNRQPLHAIDLGGQLTLHRMSSAFARVAVQTSPRQFELLTPIGLQAHHPIIIADCQHAEVLEQYQRSSHTLWLLRALHFKYHFPIYIGEWVTESFSIHPNKHGQSALYYQQGQHSEELLTEVHMMQSKFEAERPLHWLHLELDLGNNKLISMIVRLWHAYP